jgi:hypothetical protein
MIVGDRVEDIIITMPRDTYNTGNDIPTFNAYLTVIVRDSEGKVVKAHRQRSRSPTANFIGLLLPVQYFANCNCEYDIINTEGSINYYTIPNTSSYSYISYPNAANNYPSYLVMIQVGSGSQSNPYSAYSLASPIANGSGAGQLVYGTPSVSTNITVSGSSAYFYITQAFNNYSGAAITITEVGIITQIQLTQSGFSSSINFGQVLMWYDVLSSSISVPNGGTVVIYYTFAVNP